jgi:aspartyl-tRNA(Asn)/glutamyl-tRNA(Gln) amidotransferase subunit A
MSMKPDTMSSPGCGEDILADPEGFPSGYGEYFAAREGRIRSFLQFGRAPGSTKTPESAPGPVSGVPSARAVAGDAAAGSLAGLPFAVKDNIAVEGLRLSCGSKILEGFVSPYTATAVRKLEAAGAFVAGKTNLDEFGMGSSTDNSAYQLTDNPWAAGRVPGGSSGGSAAAVAAGLVPFALGSDTGGSVRQPASFCGVVGLKPSYGAVSRFGLVAYASSLETIGVVGDTTARVRAVFEAMRGEDPMDQTSRNAPACDADEVRGSAGAAGIRIGVLSVGQGELDPAVARGYAIVRERLAALGCELVDLTLPTLDYVVPAYYTIATAEASANFARDNGIRYGPRAPGAENPDTLIEASREAGFGAEVKLRILLGTFVLRSGFQDRYYLRAQKVRTAIRNDFARVFTGRESGSGAATPAGAQVPGCDALLMPVFPVPAWARGEGELSGYQQKAADKFTCAANLAGLPALAFPGTVEEGLPVGVQVMAPAFRENLLFDISAAYEAAHPIARPAGYRAFWS